MRKFIFALIATAALATCASAAQYTLNLDPSKTKIDWTLGDVLHTVHGTFKLTSGSISFDPTTGAASGRIVVDATSGDSGSDARDKRMHANVLESKKYPEAVFVPNHIQGELDVPGASNVKVHGTFTIHGAPHELTLDAKTDGTANSLKATLTFDIPYVAWGMKDPSNFILKVNKTVQMSVQTEGSVRKD